MPDAGRDARLPDVTVEEVRVLDGPNLYFARPAIKVSLRLSGYLGMRRTDAERLGARLGMRAVRPGKRGTALRQRFVMRLLRTVTRRLGAEIGVGRLGVRVRAGRPRPTSSSPSRGRTGRRAAWPVSSSARS